MSPAKRAKLLADVLERVRQFLVGASYYDERQRGMVHRLVRLWSLPVPEDATVVQCGANHLYWLPEGWDFHTGCPICNGELAFVEAYERYEQAHRAEMRITRFYTKRRTRG